jgi:predicted AlkP superfamily pyrophosphatase or phosphodiesterase
VAALVLAAALGLRAPGEVAGAPAPPRPRPAVLLISIDGLRPDYVLEADRYGLRIPNLRSFLTRGAYATGVRGVLPTVTYPSHTTLVTGVAPARHGVTANTTFDPLARNAQGWYWYAQDIKVPTLWDAARAAGLATANVHWPVTVGATFTYSLPQYWRAGTPDDRKLLRALATPGLLDSLEATLGPYPDGADETIVGDEGRGRFAARLLETKKPGFMVAYFTALDHQQHESGPGTPEVLSVLERIDSIVGRLMEAADQAYWGRVVVSIVSDHGFLGTDHDVNLYAEFRRAGLIDFDSDSAPRPLSWVATIWPAGASGAVMLKDPADTAIRATVAALLDSLAADSASGVDRILDAEAMRQLDGFPDATYLVALRPGYELGFATTGPLVTPATHAGMHGYLPDLPEMRSSFLLMGPGVAAGRNLGEIDMRDIASTLAALLRVELPQAEGHNLLTPVGASLSGRP